MIEGDSESHMRTQIVMAAAGCISGSGAEWPHLLRALRHYGERAHKDMMATTLRTAARRVCTRMGWNHTPELHGLLDAARARGPMTPKEIYEQRSRGFVA